MGWDPGLLVAWPETGMERTGKGPPVFSGSQRERGLRLSLPDKAMACVGQLLAPFRRPRGEGDGDGEGGRNKGGGHVSVFSLSFEQAGGAERASGLLCPGLKRQISQMERARGGRSFQRAQAGEPFAIVPAFSPRLSK